MDVHSKEPDVPFLSVVIPVYKVELYLRECLDSVLQQGGVDLEVILVDDGSPDGCPAICDEYAAKDSRVRVLHKQNGGLAAARKSGVHLATGRYIGFVDGDDWIEPTMYATLCGEAEETGADMVGCNFFLSFPDRQVARKQQATSGRYDEERLRDDLRKIMLKRGRHGEYGLFPSVWCKVFERELLERTLADVPDRVHYGEDLACTIPFLMRATKVSLLDDPLYHYRQHSGQSVQDRSSSRRVESLSLWVDHVRRVTQVEEVEVMLAQIDHYAQLELEGILAALFRDKLSWSYRADVARELAGSATLRDVASRTHVGPLPMDTRASLWFLRLGFWPGMLAIVGVASSLKRGLRVAKRLIKLGR